MGDLKRRWFSNSLVNLVGGIASALVSLLLPSLVVRHLSQESFSVWNLSLQVIAYVSLLSLGLQSATARSIAHAADIGHDNNVVLCEIVCAARNISHWAAAGGVALVFLLAALYPLMFPSVNPMLLHDFRITVSLFGLAAISQILAQTDMGIFQGMHRNEFFVAIQTSVRFITLLVVWLGALMKAPLVVLAGLMTLAMFMQWPLMRWALLRWVPWAKQVAKVALDRRRRKELLQYCGTLSVWSLSMLFVNSVGILIVGHNDFIMAGPYAVAMTATTVLVGFLGALLSPLMTTVAAMYADGNTRKKIPDLLTRSTIFVSIFLGIISSIVISYNPLIVRIWLGESLVGSVGPLLAILVSSYCLRNVASPYALMLIGTGLNKRALISAVIEGVANVIASIAFGMKWGAIGVAFGALLGAFVGLAGTLILNVSRTPELTPHPLRFSFISVVLPIIFFIPLNFYLAITSR